MSGVVLRGCVLLAIFKDGLPRAPHSHPTCKQVGGCLDDGASFSLILVK